MSSPRHAYLYERIEGGLTGSQRIFATRAAAWETLNSLRDTALFEERMRAHAGLEAHPVSEIDAPGPIYFAFYCGTTLFRVTRLPLEGLA